MLHKHDLFEARTHGYKTYRSPGIVVTEDGTVLASAEARPGQGGDCSLNDVLVRRSSDGGRSCSPSVTLTDRKDFGEGTVSNFGMIPERGVVHADTRPHRDRRNPTIRVSEDDCAAWAHSRVLEPGPAGCSDPAVLPDGAILCLYECDIVERIHDDRYLRPARFDLDWVRGGE
jgi:hypothetical protein